MMRTRTKWWSIASNSERTLFGNESLHANLAKSVAYLPSAVAKSALCLREAEFAELIKQEAAAQPFSILPRGCRVSGLIYISSPMIIDCEVNGQIIASGELIITENALVNASVFAGSVKVEGQVVGDIVARQRIELTGSAQMDGNIRADRIIIHENAVLNGKCNMKAVSPPVFA